MIRVFACTINLLKELREERERAEKAEADNARLRSELKEIADWFEGGVLATKARRALKKNVTNT